MPPLKSKVLESMAADAGAETEAVDRGAAAEGVRAGRGGHTGQRISENHGGRRDGPAGL